MTKPGSRALTGLVENARALLLDFDGPMCNLFGVVRASDVALSIRQFATDHGQDLSGVQTFDPLELMRAAYHQSAEFGHAVETRVIEHEIHAASSAIPTPGGHNVVRRAQETGRDVAIVSNNSERPIRAYLDRHNVADAVGRIIARPYGEPGRMKPSPFLLREALVATECAPAEALFVGDSITDMLAGAKANVPCVGYAKGDPDRANELANSDAAAVILNMQELARLFDTR